MVVDASLSASPLLSSQLFEGLSQRHCAWQLALAAIGLRGAVG